MQLLFVGVAPLLIIAACAATARAIGGDPMLGAELSVVGLTLGWLALLSRSVTAAVEGHRELQGCTRRMHVRGWDVRVLEASRATEAFVLGPLRPEIFVSRSLLEILDAEELEAVLLHEEHHQRTRAPLRTLALAAWMRIIGLIPVLGRWIERRLTQLEIDADRYAMAAGATRAAIASALVKCDRNAARVGLGYASAADVRLRQLVGESNRGDLAATPLEWLVPAALSFGLAACHLFLG